MKKGTELPAGQMIALSTGCYSDYGVNGFAKLLKPINESVWNQMVAASLEDSGWKAGGKRFNSTKAQTWLAENGYIEDQEYVELHMGDYGDTPNWEDA